LALRYAELGYSPRAEDIETIYKGFTKLADRKKCIYDQDLIALISAASKGSDALSPDAAGANNWAVVARA